VIGPEDVSRLTDSWLQALGEAVSQEQRKRSQGAALSPDAVGREVDRLLAVEAARRKVAAEDRQEHLLRVLKLRIARFEDGRQIGMCQCRDCLSGYIVRDVRRLCLDGQRQFWAEADPYVRMQ
jgi:hypothetical protein